MNWTSDWKKSVKITFAENRLPLFPCELLRIYLLKISWHWNMFFIDVKLFELSQIMCSWLKRFKQPTNRPTPFIHLLLQSFFLSLLCSKSDRSNVIHFTNFWPESFWFIQNMPGQYNYLNVISGIREQNLIDP